MEEWLSSRKALKSRPHPAFCSEMTSPNSELCSLTSTRRAKMEENGLDYQVEYVAILLGTCIRHRKDEVDEDRDYGFT